MSGTENPQTQAPQNDVDVQYETLEPGRMSAEMQRKIKLIDPMYPHDMWSGLQVGFLMFFVFLGAQTLSFWVFSMELPRWQIWNAVLFATVYVITQVIRRPSRIAWLRRKGRLSLFL